MKLFARLFKNEDGATAIEYGLIAALLSVAIISGVSSVGSSTGTTFTTIDGKMKAADTAAKS
jgi:pilus assembly protein Flp/PilA